MLGQSSELSSVGNYLSRLTSPCAPEGMAWQQTHGDYERTGPMDCATETSTSYGDGFASGFAAFRQTGDFSDVCVVISGKEHHLHSLILAYHSLYFRRAFSNGMRESAQRRLELSFLDDPLALLPAVIDYFYEGQVVLTNSTCFGLLALAKHLLVPKLEHYCRWVACMSCFAQTVAC